MICIKILAIDQASRCSGYSVGINGKLDQYGTIKATGEGDDRICDMANKIKEKIIEVNPDKLYVEHIQLQSGNVSTYNMLARLQGMIIWIARELNVPLEIVPPVTWKASIGICKGKRQEQKEACIEFVESKYSIDLYESDDMADSIGILTYAMNNNE